MIRHECLPGGLQRNHGFSLIEVMVALVISMILLLALATLLMETTNSNRELAKQSRQIENGTYAMLMLGKEVKHAGFYGLFSAKDQTDPVAMPDPCTDQSYANFSNALLDAIKLPIQGYNNDAPAPVNGCINNTYLANTDVLVIRRVNTDFNAIDNVTATNRLYLQSTATAVKIDTGNADPFDLEVSTANPPALVKDGNNPPLAPTFEYLTHIYYVSSCNVCTGGGDGIPTLYRAYLGSTGTFINEPLVDGIEQFQVEYGLDTTGNGSPNNFTQDPTVAGDLAATIAAWRQVVAVRLYILARNNEKTRYGGYQDQKTYNLGLYGNYTPDATAPSQPHLYKRHMFTSTFKLMSLQ